MSDEAPRLPNNLVNLLPAARTIAMLLGDAGIALSDLRRQTEDEVKRGAVSAARAFVVLHRLKSKIDELAKVYSTLFEDYKVRVLPELFDDEGVSSVPLTEGYRVGVSQKLYASIRPESKEAAYEWLRENDLGDLISSTVNASTLSAAAKHELEENGREFPPDLFNVAIVPTTSVTVTRSK